MAILTSQQIVARFTAQERILDEMGESLAELLRRLARLEGARTAAAEAAGSAAAAQDDEAAAAKPKRPRGKRR